MVSLLLKLLIAHSLADFVLQPDSMARGKNRHYSQVTDKKGGRPPLIWPYWLTAHALFHGGAVWLVTGSMALGLVETGIHWIIDFAKCENWINFHTDQLFHVLCKALYLVA
jgi:hypothetical protein